jgi:YfiR/HmsC-like
MGTRLLGLLLLLVPALLAGAPALAGVPVEPAVKVLVRVLSYDRKLGTRAPPGPLRIGVVFDSGSLVAASEADLALSTLDGLFASAVGPRLLGDAIALPTADGRWSERLAGLGAVVICRASEADLALIVPAAAALGIPLLSLDGELVGNGVPLGVTQRQARLEILIDLAGARAAGLDLSAEILQLATQVGP